MIPVRTLLAGSLACAALIAAPDADACGGCFAPQDPPTVVSGHRMAMSVSPTQSVLWDQIQYSGEPEEFAWVLPIKPGARIEVSRAAFFETLETTTAVRVTPPMLDCGSSDGGIGCSSQLSLGALDSAAEAGDGGEGGRTVDVVHQGTVGPYETVTLSTETPGALNEWLTDHGYQVDPTSQPIIDAYVSEGFDFIALRLLPGKGVSEMTPVRVVSPESSITLPLRMVAIGTGAQTPIVLYVIGEGRYKIETFTEVAINRGLLSWDFADLSTNYETLRQRALAENDGRSFVTTFAGDGALTAGFFTTYANQAVANQESLTCSAPFPIGEQGVVRNPCPPEEPWDSPACGAVTDGLDARRFGCEDLDDLAVAFEGLHVEDVWLTRMEMILPKAALATDMTLGAAPAQAYVSNDIEAGIAVNAEGACPAGTTPRVGPGRDAPRTNGRDLILLGCVAVAAMLARRAGQRFARAAERKNA
jgi:hypothetical protein